MKLTEGHIHVAARRLLRQQGFVLIAGQYPGGSDDELCALNVVDPTVACDDSPDPRRHSDGKLVPDLVALRRNVLLVVEMKPDYSEDDYRKLVVIRDQRRSDFDSALTRLSASRAVAVPSPATLLLVPVLGFRAKARYAPDPQFGYLLVESLDHATLHLPDTVRSLLDMPYRAEESV